MIKEAEEQPYREQLKSHFNVLTSLSYRMRGSAGDTFETFPVGNLLKVLLAGCKYTNANSHSASTGAKTPFIFAQGSILEVQF